MFQPVRFPAKCFRRAIEAFEDVAVGMVGIAKAPHDQLACFWVEAHSLIHLSGTISALHACACWSANQLRGEITIRFCCSVFSHAPHQLNVLLAVIPWRHNDITSISSCGLPLSTTVPFLCRAEASRHQPSRSETTKKRAPA